MADGTRADYIRKKIDRNLRLIEASDAGKRCVICSHVKHNDLGYCQVGQCGCSNGCPVGGMAAMVRRDLNALFDLVDGSDS